MQLGLSPTEGPQEMMQNTTPSDLLHSDKEVEFFFFTNHFSMIKSTLRDINFPKFLFAMFIDEHFTFVLFVLSVPFVTFK